MPDTVAARIDALFAEWDRPGSPGVAVGVTRGGGLVFAKGYGLANLEYGVPVTPSTIFHVASVSKQFTAFAVALLERDGLLSVDDDVRAHLRDLPDLGRPVTLRHLLHHTSGVRDQWELVSMAGWRMDDVISRDQILAMMRRQRGLNFEPGSEYLYSNMGYSLLAEVVARVGGRPFPEWMQERVFAPLEMTRTHVHADHRRVVPDRAYSYAPDEGGGWRNAVLSYANQGATSLFTTVADLARWIGNLEEPTVGDSALVERMLDRGVLTSGDTLDYAFALSVGTYRGLRTVGHGGADAGFRSHLLHFPDQRVGVVVLGNGATLDAGRAARQVAEVFLEDVMEPAPAEEAPAPRPRVPLPAETLEGLAGTYLVDLVPLTIRVGDSALVAEAGEDQRWGLEPESEREFWVPGRAGRLTFTRDAEGRTDGFVLRSAEGVLRGRRVWEAEISPATLGELAGAYYSPELDTTYRLRVEGGELRAEHQRHPPIRLVPMGRDTFAGSTWFFRTATFTRDAAGRPDGFLVTGGRVRDLRFDRAEGSAEDCVCPPD